MKIIRNVCHYLIYAIGLFFVLMSFDMFDPVSTPDLNTFWERLLGFFIHSSPGLVIILLNFLLRKKDLIMGLILVCAAIFFMFFFGYIRDISEHFLSILLVILPPLACGVILIITRNRF